ncbi:RagB/SusD family nutrient uptake outer membrane protein [uncultured Bacteroides sp.]|uniref:RagB/SusD family nutrient uptake outer membrane protein n=1 Tax=uncultured Bacteroides sp. TaxID=162156 RepID=UPI002AA86980|nr:RagB/SusD family nutrient uptake outer membrane protein [uncultured Bacteroides sp.]
MKNIFKTGALALSMIVGLCSCNDFFDSIPGEQYDLEGTFSSKAKTEQYLNNVYTYVPDETQERYPTSYRGGIWTGGSLEANITWSWQITNEWTAGTVYASSSWINYWFIEYYKGISKASTFIANVDKCAEATENDRRVWKAQARALRAYYYYLLFRSYGPIVLLGEEAIPLDTPLADLLKERNSVDECVDFITTEFDKAAEDLPTKYTGSNLGRIDKGTCKAFKAKTLLYAASPLFNCNSDYAGIVNADGKQLFSQDTSQEQTKWEAARDAYKEFFDSFVPSSYSLYVVTNNGKIDFYESCRQVTSGVNYDDTNKEQIFIKLADHSNHTYEITPYHGHVDDSSIKGGLGFGTTQEMVDLFFTNKGLRTVDDADYKEYTGVPSSSDYGWSVDYNDPQNSDINFFKANTNMTLKQWANREPRFYVNITFNGSTWVDDATNYGKVTTDLTLNGNSGYNKAGHDAPLEGYGVRKMAPKNGVWSGKHCANLLRLADMYLGYAETLSACGEYGEAMKYVNAVRARAGVPGYGNDGGTDDNGLTYITYPSNRDDVDKRIRRERLIELAYEWNRYFDVRRWKVADMAVGDDWIYPSYHKGGEGGDIHGMNSKADAPQFFEKVVTETRVFDKRHYLFPIPDEDIRRNSKMVQNYGWAVAEPTE